MSTDARTARRLLDFELAIDAAVAEEVVEAEWGRAFLCPGLPRVYDASFLAIERRGMTMREVAELADEILGGAGFAHRTALAVEPAEGARLAAEIGTAPGWRVERAEYMVWERDSGRRPAVEVREAGIEEIAPLRAELIGEWLPTKGPRTAFAPNTAVNAALEPNPRERDETAGQLVELGRRCGAAAGDRWFLAPAAEPQAACCLFSDGQIGQVEDVGTLERSRGRGLAQAVVLGALEASRAAGHELTFLSADAEDWPRLLYAKLGFRKVGEIQLLRRFPDTGDKR